MPFATVETSRLLWAAGIVISYAAFCTYIWQRQRTKQPVAPPVQQDTILLGWASQSGSAQGIAETLAQQLEHSGHSVVCLPLDQLSVQQLERCTTHLYVVSTYDDGLPPEHARRFIRLLEQTSLTHNNIQILGLGDRRYPHFCQFAQQLQQALLQRGAQLALPLITVDNLHPQDLQQWQAAVNQRFNLKAKTQPAANQWNSATLVQRSHLNPDSTSPGLYLLQFATQQIEWQAGDTIRVRPLNDPQLSPREYSIASAPGNELALVVRVAGNCSGWLCNDLEIGSNLAFELVTKPSFHDEHTSAPAIFIGAGSGLAGLRGHILSRSSQQNWLIFGERCPDSDAVLASEGAQWLASGRVQQIDYAFSRDAENPRYVQDCLEQQQQQLRQWLEQGALIFLCGSLQGMGRSALHKLEQLIGAPELEQLRLQGRLKTDLY